MSDVGLSMAGTVFLNYRRGEDSAAAGRLYDQLLAKFTAKRLFMDVDSVPAGRDFVRDLETQVARCDVLLAVIGPSWANVRKEGQRRLDRSDDFVRIEIESALKLGKTIIPVLVNDAPMPAAEALPDGLKPLAHRNAVRLTHDHFRADASCLIKSIEVVLAEIETRRRQAARTRVRQTETQPSRRLLLAAGSGAMIAAGAGLLWVFRRPPPSEAPTLLPPPQAPTLLPPQAPTLLPSALDYSSMIGIVRQQRGGPYDGSLGYALAAALEFQITKAIGGTHHISVHYINYLFNDKMAVATLVSLEVNGAVEESEWPDDNLGRPNKPPPSVAKAKRFRITAIRQLTEPISLNEVKQVLKENGPLVAGITAFEGLQDPGKTGVVPMPPVGSIPAGSHAILLVGYDDATKCVKFINCWGRDWGEEGFGYLPYGYVEQYAVTAWSFKFDTRSR